MTVFAQRVLDAVDRIPRGCVMSYGDVAEYVDMGSARAVGMVMARYGAQVPWHRVLRADGTCAPGVAQRQLAALRREKVPIRGDRIDMTRARGDGGEDPAPDRMPRFVTRHVPRDTRHPSIEQPRFRADHAETGRNREV